jgi:hypothetical protein
MTRHPVHPGRPMQPMVSTSAQPPTTTGASNSTSHPRDASVSPTRGAYIQPIAKSLLLHNMISPLPLQQTFSSHLGALYLQQPLQKIKHIRAIQKMTAIMAGQQAPAMLPAQRVVESTPRMATTSNNIMAPNIIRNMPCIHQRQTCNNNPFHILANDDGNVDTVVASNCTPHIPPPSLPTSDLQGNPPMRHPICQSMKQPTSLPPTF